MKIQDIEAATSPVTSNATTEGTSCIDVVSDTYDRVRGCGSQLELDTSETTSHFHTDFPNVLSNLNKRNK